MEQQSFDLFNPKTIKLAKDGKRVIVTGSIGETDEPGDETTFKELTKNAIPHEDLINVMNRLKSSVLVACGYGAKECKKLVSDLTMLGVHESGEEDKRGVILSAKLQVPGGVIALNTPRIVLSHDTMKIEDNVEEVVEDLKVEAYSYLYEDKRADPELFQTKMELVKTTEKKAA